MKKLLIILLSLTSLNLFSQDLEKKICECVKTNFEHIDVDYFHIIDHIEADLISNNIIEKSLKSRIEQIKHVSQAGFVEQTRSYENILIEQLGLRTIKYCINLHTYDSRDYHSSEYFMLMRELEVLNKNIQDPINLIELKRETARIILKYGKNAENSELWKLLLVEYLFLFSETKEMRAFSKLIPFDFTEQDTSNTVNIHVNSINEVFFINQRIEKNQICQFIKEPIEKGFGVHFTNDRTTKYKTYLEIYNGIKDCIQSLREDKSMELYNQVYKSLDKDQEGEVNRLIPLRIVETEPK